MLGIVRSANRPQTRRMDASNVLVDLFRTLTGQRRERLLPRRCAKPAIGTRIVLPDGGMRMTLPAGVSDALWAWLLDAGWRVERHRPDRRHYRDIPRFLVEQLLSCDPTHDAIPSDRRDDDKAQPTLDFPASRRKLPRARANREASERVRFLKSSELEDDRVSRIQRPGS